MKIKEVKIKNPIINSEKDIDRLKAKADLFLIGLYLSDNEIYEDITKIHSAFRDIHCKEKDFIRLYNCKYDLLSLYINKKSSFINIVNLSFKNLENENYSNFRFNYIKRVMYGTFNFGEIFSRPIYMYIKPDDDFMDNFEFEKLGLTKEQNQLLYLNLGKNIKKVISAGKNNTLEKTLKRCLDNLPEDLKLVLEIESNIGD